MKQLLLKIENCYQCEHNSWCYEGINIRHYCTNFNFPETRTIENPVIIPDWCKLEDYKG